MRYFTPRYETDRVVVTVNCCNDVQMEEEQEMECSVCSRTYSFYIDEEDHIKVRYRGRARSDEPSEQNMCELLTQAIGTFYKYANNREVQPREALKLGLFFGCMSNLLEMISDEMLVIATDAERMQKWRQERTLIDE